MGPSGASAKPSRWAPVTSHNRKIPLCCSTQISFHLQCVCDTWASSHLQASFRGDGKSPGVPQKPCSKAAAPTPPKRRNSTLWSETLDIRQKGTFSTKEIKRQEVKIRTVMRKSSRPVMQMLRAWKADYQSAVFDVNSLNRAKSHPGFIPCLWKLTHTCQNEQTSALLPHLPTYPIYVRHWG